MFAAGAWPYCYMSCSEGEICNCIISRVQAKIWIWLLQYCLQSECLVYLSFYELKTIKVMYDDLDLWVFYSDVLPRLVRLLVVVQIMRLCNHAMFRTWVCTVMQAIMFVSDEQQNLYVCVLLHQGERFHICLAAIGGLNDTVNHMRCFLCSRCGDKRWLVVIVYRKQLTATVWLDWFNKRWLVETLLYSWNRAADLNGGMIWNSEVVPLYSISKDDKDRMSLFVARCCDCSR